MAPQPEDKAAIACSLDRSALAARHDDVARLFDAGLIAADRQGNALELRFGASYEPRVQALAAAERECCPFMDIEVRREGPDVVLGMDSPPEAATTLDPFAELAARALA